MSLPVRIVDPGARASTVVLLHGAPTAPADLVPLAERLAAEHRVLIPSLPGYDGAPALQPPYSLERVWDALEKTLAEHRVEEAILIGFSLGAYHAVSLAIRARIRPTALVSLGGFAGLTAEERDGMGGLAPLLRALPDATDPSLRTMFKARMLSPAYLEANPARGEQVARWLDAVHPSVLADELEAASRAPDLYDALGRLKLPVLARVGALDVASPVAMSERLMRAARHGELHVVLGKGHALPVEDLEETAGAVKTFLRRG